MTKERTIAIAGAGFSGVVLARELAESNRFNVELFESKDHIAGNCHTTRDVATGIMIHHFGPHIFNTSREDVWAYVNRFATFMPFTNRVKAVTARGVFSLPINLLTINQFFGKRFNPREAEAFIRSLGDSKISEPRNFEEQALKMLGRDLYQNFFYGYTKKQWGVDPKRLPASILKRLPVRFTYDDNYYNQKYQGLPVEGYTVLMERIIDHPRIRLHLNYPLTRDSATSFEHLFFSGPMDQYYAMADGPLQYRTIDFERIDAAGDYQGNPVINYCEASVPYTRISEHKHFAPWETHEKTVCFREYSRLAEGNDPVYYPLRLDSDKTAIAKYVRRSQSEKRTTFIGRLGTYRYLDMHMAIGESLDLAKTILSNEDSAKWPRFSGAPI